MRFTNLDDLFAYMAREQQITKLCDYQFDGQAFTCRLCGDQTTNQHLRRVCPILRHETTGSEWSYGVTTVPQRIEDGTLQRTLESLAVAGFDRPRLFVDGRAAGSIGEYEMTCRDPAIKAFGNWMLAAWELYVRNPRAKFYAIFQDDCIASRGLRQYLGSCKYPARGYWNLYTDARNQSRLIERGWHLANQRGFGAVGLVFDNVTMRVILSSPHLVNRPLTPVRGTKNIDGAVVTALRKGGWREYVHNPSLLQHTGEVSTLGHSPHRTAPRFAQAIKPRQRVGLVGYNCWSGLGVLNRQIATYCDIWSWLVKPHSQYETLPAVHMGVYTKVCRSGLTVAEFVQDVDVVLFAETPYWSHLVPEAKKHGKTIVCVPMLEWLPKRGTWVDDVDLFVCPTEHSFDAVRDMGLPAKLFRWPVDVEAFEYRQRTTCKRFLFLNGHGGHNGRKGGRVIRQLVDAWPNIPLIVHDQAGHSWPEGLDVRRNVPANGQLYGDGDVLICPHHADGLGLEPMEAASAGVPAIVPHGRPWEHVPAIARICAEQTKPHWHESDVDNLVAICREMLGADISADSRRVRDWAEENDWRKRAGELDSILQSAAQKTSPSAR